MAPSKDVGYDEVVSSIRANTESDQTAKTYVGAMNAVRRVTGDQPIGQALTRAYKATYAKLVQATSSLKPGTLKTRITGIMGAFKLCPALVQADSDGAARDFWSDLHKIKLSEVRAEASSNLASPAQIKNMVELKHILKAARSLTHATMRQSQDKVLLTIAALVPAKRADWARLRIVKNLAAVTDNENAVIVKPSEVQLVLNKYKTKRTYGRHLEEIEGEAADAIRDSLAAHPRAYLFTSPARPNGMSNDAFASYLSNTFDRHMRKHVTVDLLRHMWVTQSVDPRKMTVRQIDDLARKMLHGADTQRLYFLVKS